MNKNLIVISILFFMTAAMAAEPELEQFASAYELQTDGSAAIYKLDLPKAIYQKTVRQDLGGIRVFNSEKTCASCYQATSVKPGKRKNISRFGIFPIDGNSD